MNPSDEDTEASGEVLDELNEARQSRRAHELHDHISGYIAGMGMMNRNQVRLLMLSGALSRADVEAMIRGQLLTWDEGCRRPCEDQGLRFSRKDIVSDAELRAPPRGRTHCDGRDDDDDQERRFTELPRRTAPQVGDPRFPPPRPPYRLKCPLQLRAEAGDATVPCARAQMDLLPPPLRRKFKGRDAPRREIKTEADITEQILDDIVSTELTPCGTLHEFMRFQGEKLVLRAPRPAPVAPPVGPGGDLRARVARRHLQVFQQHTATAEHAEVESARAGLRFMLESQRFEKSDLGGGLVWHGTVVTHQGWLPCRDSLYRDMSVSHNVLEDVPKGPDGKENYRDRTNFLRDRALEAPYERSVCHLIEEVWAGKRDAPCCEALKHQTRPDWVEPKVDPGFTPEQARLYAERHPPAPVYWQRPEEAPGEPEDPVITQQMRPCYLLGKLMQADLYDFMLEIAETPMEDPPELKDIPDDDDDEDEGDEEDDDADTGEPSPSDD